MARTAKIHFQRVTLSLPKEVLAELRRKIPKNGMSKYVANLVKEDLEKQDTDVERMRQNLDKIRKNLVFNDPRPSIEILREIRYGEV